MPALLDAMPFNNPYQFRTLAATGIMDISIVSMLTFSSTHAPVILT